EDMTTHRERTQDTTRECKQATADAGAQSQERECGQTGAGQEQRLPIEPQAGLRQPIIDASKQRMVEIAQTPLAAQRTQDFAWSGEPLAQRQPTIDRLGGLPGAKEDPIDRLDGEQRGREYEHRNDRKLAHNRYSQLER